jgi:hypothetical protein
VSLLASSSEGGQPVRDRSPILFEPIVHAVAVAVLVPVGHVITIAVGRRRRGSESLFAEIAETVAVSVLGQVEEAVAVAVPRAERERNGMTG